MRITNDPLITRHLLKTTMPFTAVGSRRLISRILTKKRAVWAIESGQLIGLIGISGEFGYWLARSAWAKVTPVQHTFIVDHTFPRLKVEALHASLIADSKVSHPILRKLGFQEDRIASAFCCERSKVMPLMRYKLDRHRWEDA